MLIKRLLVALVVLALLMVGAFTILSGGSGSNKAAAVGGVTPANAVEAAVEQSENAVLAALSPMAVSSDQSTACTSVHCNPSAPSSAIPQAAEEGFTDNPALPVGTGSEATSIDQLNSSAAKPYSPALVDARNGTVLNSVFASSIAQPIYTVAHNAMTTQAQWLANGGSSCATTTCIIVGAAGAEVQSFSNETIGPSTATVTATVNGWQDDAHYTGGKVSLIWKRVSTQLIVQETLTLGSNNVWQVTNRVGDVAPGAGP